MRCAKSEEEKVRTSEKNAVKMKQRGRIQSKALKRGRSNREQGGTQNVS